MNPNAKITDEQFHLMEERFGVKGREGYLS